MTFANCMKIVFWGTPQAAVPSLERILSDGHEIVAVYTQPDRPSGRGNKIVYSPVKQFAIEHDLPVLQPTKIKTDDALETFKSHNADVAVVVAYGRILPESFLTVFRRGAINVHFSLLPKYRGAAPVNWAIANGETETGVTTMQMDAGLDTGTILMQKATEIGGEETAVELMSRLSLLGAELLSEMLAKLDDLKPQPQDSSLATFAPIMKREDGLIDWQTSAIEIANRVRGFQPFPTAFTHYGDTRITIWRAKCEDTIVDCPVGQIVDAKGDNLVIACGHGTALRILEIQPEGKRRMTTRDFLNGLSINVETKQVEIISFYEFKEMSTLGVLAEVRDQLKQLFAETEIRGTIILADEGYNGMVCGYEEQNAEFVYRAEKILQTTLRVKSSYHNTAPFRKIDVKIKPEIVTLKREVDISLGKGTHVDAQKWNTLISQPDVLLLDARNDYEYKTGTFRGAINPDITKFSDLPKYVAEQLDPAKHKRVAMFCTGGIRCEKFAPYMKQLGFEEVYQLDGGILKYLEQTPEQESLWEGECYVFDERVTVDATLAKGSGTDHSMRLTKRKNPLYKTAE
jgi:methionyl-tRNA formyltransferase